MIIYNLKMKTLVTLMTNSSNMSIGYLGIIIPVWQLVKPKQHSDLPKAIDILVRAGVRNQVFMAPNLMCRRQ